MSLNAAPIDPDACTPYELNVADTVGWPTASSKKLCLYGLLAAWPDCGRPREKSERKRSTSPDGVTRPGNSAPAVDTFGGTRATVFASSSAYTVWPSS